MKSIPAALLRFFRAKDQRPVLLVQLAGWGGATIRWAATKSAVSYDGETWNPQPSLAVGALQQRMDGGTQGVTVRVSNADLAMSTLIDQANPKGATLTVYQVFLDDLTNAATLVGGLLVKSYRLSSATADFLCEGSSGPTRRRVPARKYYRTCYKVYKSADCGYAGADSSCDRTDTDCKAKDNFDNFGGWLFVLPRIS